MGEAETRELTEVWARMRARQQLPLQAGGDSFPAPTLGQEQGPGRMAGGTTGVPRRAPFEASSDAASAQQLSDPGKDFTASSTVLILIFFGI